MVDRFTRSEADPHAKLRRLTAGSSGVEPGLDLERAFQRTSRVSNEAMIPSPVCLTSRPRAETSARRMIRSCSVSRTMNAACPTSSRIDVEPSRSVNRIVRKGVIRSLSSPASFIRPRNRRTSSSETLMISLGMRPCVSRCTAVRSAAAGAFARQKASLVIRVEPVSEEAYAEPGRCPDVGLMGLRDLLCRDARYLVAIHEKWHADPRAVWRDRRPRAGAPEHIRAGAGRRAPNRPRQLGHVGLTAPHRLDVEREGAATPCQKSSSPDDRYG